MLRNAILSATLAIATMGSAQGQDYPVLHGAGDDAVVEYGTTRPGSVVGGAAVRMSGTGDNAAVAYGATTAVQGPVARLTGSRDDAALTYAPAPVPPRTLAAARDTRRGG